MRKRILSIVLTAVLTFVTLCVPVTAKTSNEATVSKQEGLMATIGIVNTDTPETSEKITRAEFAEFLWHCLKLEALENTEVLFADVPAGSNITNLATYGYFVGDGGNFEPNREMTIDEAYITAARVTGYDVLAEVDGGSIPSYRKVVRSAGLTKDVDEDDGLTFKNSMIILYNILTVPLYEMEGINKDGILYSDTKGNTLLEIRYNMKIAEGVVIATDYASVYENVSKTSENSVRIEDTVYKCNSFNYDNLLGRYVTAYYKDNTGTLEIFYIHTDDDEDEFFEISAEDFISFSGNSIRYYDNNRAKSVKLEDDAVFIRNGQSMILATESEKAEALKMNYGSIDLYKSGKSSYYTVIITEIENAVVTSVNTEKEIVYAEKPDGSTIYFDKSDTDFFRIYREISNEQLQMSTLSNGNLISYAVSSDGACVKIYLCTNSVSGTVQSVLNEDDEKIVKINDVEYTVNTVYAQYGDFRTGANTTYLLDIFGNIAYEPEGKRTNNVTFAYFYDISKNDDGFDTKVRIKVYTTDKKHEKLNIAEKCRIDGAGSKKSSDVFAALTDGSNNPVRQLIAYKLDSDGNIDSIDVAAADKESREGKNTLWVMGEYAERTYRREDASKYYTISPADGEPNSLGYPMDNSTKVIHVPSLDSVITSEEENLFSVGNATSLTGNDVLNVTIYKYNDDSPYADFVVPNDAEFSEPRLSATAYLINDVSTKIASNGETVTAVNGLADTSDAVAEILISDYVFLRFSDSREVKVAAEDVKNYLSPGDIIQCGTALNIGNSEYVYRYLRVLYDYSEDMTYWATEDDKHKYENKTYNEWMNSNKEDKYRFTFGYVDSLYIEHDMLNLKPVTSIITSSDYNHESKDVYARSTGWARFTIFDDTRRIYENAYRGIPGDIIDYQTGREDASRIFVRWGTERPVGYVIYR